jgi:hypothetical protein
LILVMMLGVEVLLIGDLGEVLHDRLEARMVGCLEAGLRLRPRLVPRLVLEVLVSQMTLAHSSGGGAGELYLPCIPR